MKDFRRELRNNGTPAEAFLWTRLKGRQVEGLQFRRQFSVENYILDFYCPELRLAIELDGEIHNQQIEYDRARTLELMEKHGIKVLRYENRLVFEHLGSILSDISAELHKQQQKTPPLS